MYLYSLIRIVNNVDNPPPINPRKSPFVILRECSELPSFLSISVKQASDAFNLKVLIEQFPPIKKCVPDECQHTDQVALGQ